MNSGKSAGNQLLFLLILLFGAAALIIFIIPDAHSNLFMGAYASALFSILIDALPFLVGGSLLSVLIHELVPQAWIDRLFRRSSVLGLIAASFSGILLPLCECGIVPIVRNLMRNRVRPAVAMTAFLSIPLLNPLVMASTWYAFSNRPELFVMRMAGGWAAAILIGSICLVAERWIFGSTVGAEAGESCNCGHSHEHEHEHDCSCGHDHHQESAKAGLGSRIAGICEHACAEVYGSGKYLIIGALVAAPLQILLQDPAVLAGGFGSTFWAVPLAMVMAMVLSLCSSSDAFVARGFLGFASSAAITGFLLMGPFMHLRNLIQLKGLLSMGSILRFALVVFAVVLILCLTIQFSGGAV